MSRIQAAFDRLREQGRGGMVTYVTAGDPDAETSAKILIALAKAGADVLEVGVPFSDPLADGPVRQRASERALAAGMTLRGTLDVVRQVRRLCSSRMRTRWSAWTRRSSREAPARPGSTAC